MQGMDFFQPLPVAGQGEVSIRRHLLPLLVVERICRPLFKNSADNFFIQV